MNDLSGLDWSSTSTNNPKPAAAASGFSYPTLQPPPPPPLSGRSTPLSAQGAGVYGSGFSTSKPPNTKPISSNDSFANLVSFGPKKDTSKLSLQEQQKLLQEEKQRKELERKKQFDLQFGGQDTKFWDTLDSKGGSTQTPFPGPGPSPARVRSLGADSVSASINKPFASLSLGTNGTSATKDDDDDLLSGFSAATPVDSSSHYPPPKPESSKSPLVPILGQARKSPFGPPETINNDDDDPFGFGSVGYLSAKPRPAEPVQDDDDILGLLGKPVSEITKPKPREHSPPPVEYDQRESQGPAAPRDNAIADLVDMGFPADQASEALAQTDTGVNVQAAIGWLLSKAHQEAKQKSGAGDVGGNKTDRQSRASRQPREDRTHGHDNEPIGSKPAWMQDSTRSSSSQRRGAYESPNRGAEKDITQVASDVGSTLFKTANSLWSTGRKKVQKAVAEFQQEGDTNQPKWMRDVAAEGGKPAIGQDDDSGGRRREILPEHPSTRKSQRQEPNITDEALLLEAQSPPRRQPRQSEMDTGFDRTGSMSSRDQSPALLQASRPHQPPRPFPQDNEPKGRLTRQTIEEQTSQAYISPARRKKASAPVSPNPEPNLLAGGSQPDQGFSRSTTALPPTQTRNPFRQPVSAPSSKPATPKPRMATPSPSPRPQAPTRRVPPVTNSALSVSASHRQKGTEAFKRGDYAAAHTAYSAALQQLPGTHPFAIIVLCNRAVVNLKVGDPKAAVSDADTALGIIGVSRGEGEKISIANEPDKDMKEFFGRALARKAEALEQMEKWSDAAKVWKDAVEAGFGGAVSIQGRNRCEKAAGGGTSAAVKTEPAFSPVRKPPQRKYHPPKSAVLPTRPNPQAAAQSAEAVNRLRAANAAAEKVDDEKFALADIVDEKLLAWKGGKETNLRALLASLDTVLWPEAGWKKVGMHELVLAPRVKIIYMKGIAKVHPDKIPTTATTEQRMISASVFSTLNHAWDKFKNENGL